MRLLDKIAAYRKKLNAAEWKTDAKLQQYHMMPAAQQALYQKEIAAEEEKKRKIRVSNDNMNLVDQLFNKFFYWQWVAPYPLFSNPAAPAGGGWGGCGIGGPYFGYCGPVGADAVAAAGLTALPAALDVMNTDNLAAGLPVLDADVLTAATGAVSNAVEGNIDALDAMTPDITDITAPTPSLDIAAPVVG